MRGLLLLLVGCAGGDSDPTDASEDTDASDVTEVTDVVPDVPLYDFVEAKPWFPCSSEPPPDEVVSVKVFDRVDQAFGATNTRDVQAEVDLPEGSWAQVGLKLHLECPASGLCDAWDRTGSVQLITDPETGERVELLRHITPYRIEMCNYVDVTRFAHLLQGHRTITSYIDTWVGPGHSDGEGWRTSVELFYTPGRDAGPEVIGVYGRKDIIVGSATPSVDDQVDPFHFEVPDDATRVEAHLTTTGHSFGNTANCAEFCPMRTDIAINGTVFSSDQWRKNCDKNPVSPQYGTWQYPRNGWCPGAVAVGETLDITGAVLKGGDNVLDLDILLSTGQPYVNTSPVDLAPTMATALEVLVYR